MLDPQEVAKFARRLAAEEQGSAAYQAVHQEFLDYAADFITQFSYHYHDFAPREDGNVACTMDDYIRPREQVAYIVDTRTGFIQPVDKDAQRGSKYQDIS